MIFFFVFVTFVIFFWILEWGQQSRYALLVLFLSVEMIKWLLNLHHKTMNTEKIRILFGGWKWNKIDLSLSIPTLMNDSHSNEGWLNKYIYCHCKYVSMHLYVLMKYAINYKSLKTLGFFSFHCTVTSRPYSISCGNKYIN